MLELIFSILETVIKILYIFLEGDSINMIVELRKDKYGKIVHEEILGAKEEY